MTIILFLSTYPVVFHRGIFMYGIFYENGRIGYEDIYSYNKFILSFKRVHLTSEFYTRREEDEIHFDVSSLYLSWYPGNGYGITVGRVPSFLSVFNYNFVKYKNYIPLVPLFIKNIFGEIPSSDDVILVSRTFNIRRGGVFLKTGIKSGGLNRISLLNSSGITSGNFTSSINFIISGDSMFYYIGSYYVNFTWNRWSLNFEYVGHTKEVRPNPANFISFIGATLYDVVNNEPPQILFVKEYGYYFTVSYNPSRLWQFYIFGAKSEGEEETYKITPYYQLMGGIRLFPDNLPCTSIYLGIDNGGNNVFGLHIGYSY